MIIIVDVEEIIDLVFFKMYFLGYEFCLVIFLLFRVVMMRMKIKLFIVVFWIDLLCGGVFYLMYRGVEVMLLNFLDFYLLDIMC